MRRPSRLSREGQYDAIMPVAVFENDMPGEFRAGLKYGLQLAAQVCRSHGVMLARRYGVDSPAVRAVELDLYCFERGLRKFGA